MPDDSPPAPGPAPEVSAELHYRPGFSHGTAPSWQDAGTDPTGEHPDPLDDALTPSPPVLFWHLPTVRQQARRVVVIVVGLLVALAILGAPAFVRGYQAGLDGGSESQPTQSTEP